MDLWGPYKYMADQFCIALCMDFDHGFRSHFCEADPERARRAARQLPDAWTSEKT